MATWTHFTVAVIGVSWMLASSATAQTINACMNKRSGVLRVVADPGLCKKNETLIFGNFIWVNPRLCRGTHRV